MADLSERFARRAAERRVQTALEIERRAQTAVKTDRRQGKRGGRRRHDRGRPWWQKGLFFGALCIVARCWRVFRHPTQRPG